MLRVPFFPGCAATSLRLEQRRTPACSVRLLAALCLATGLASSGCKTFVKAQFNQGRGVDGESILAVPFSEPRRQLWYGESEDGRLVAEAFKAWVSARAKPNFPLGEGVQQSLRQIMNWPDRSISAAQWKQLTAGLGTKYVVYGEIHDISLQRPDRIGILEPRIEANYRVVDVGSSPPRLVYESTKFVLDTVQGQETELPLTALGADLAGAKRKLLAKLGERIGKDLYGYYDE